MTADELENKHFFCSRFTKSAFRASLGLRARAHECRLKKMYIFVEIFFEREIGYFKENHDTVNNES
ncbi:hypothetical protein PPOP_1982 [Paenibacillus popilliae ATCC 14706]|uniref:Uncharacterized protein n=1 Tax=Paenibacillus popilliae ATCC 14706 TaxID=1212764 RepID=M9LI26_PAEPP|nr:hypothetical protein PPOP_1982 [Paenibacillus popilliae ATCC 14706]